MKLLKTTLASLFLAGSLYASPFFYSSITDDFFKMDRYFDSMFDAHFTKYFSPKIEMYDDKDNYTIEFEVQGIEKSDLKLSLEDNNILTLKGEKKSPKGKEKANNTDKKYHGTFSRMIKLPDNANGEKLKAEHKNGILIVTIPKKQSKEKQSKTINID